MRIEVIKIERERIDLAIYVINLKIAQTIKSMKTYAELKEAVGILEKEKEEVYKQNEEVIKKVLNQYLEEVK